MDFLMENDLGMKISSPEENVSFNFAVSLLSTHIYLLYLYKLYILYHLYLLQNVKYLKSYIFFNNLFY